MALKVFKHQQWTLLFLVSFSILFIILLPLETFKKGEFLGLLTIAWVILAILFAVGHHTYVLLCWRLELHYSIITKLLGKYAFRVYEMGFFILFIGRILLIILVSRSNRGTSPIPPIISFIIAGLMAIPMIYTFYSVIRYFGLARASGADHFIVDYKTMPFVKRGIYKYTNNAMYKYAILIMWIPALLFSSLTGLLVALFNYIYVWVHYYTLERPDFEVIYGSLSPLDAQN